MNKGKADMSITVLVLVCIVVALTGVPATWLVMLAVGNFGFAQFGFVDCIPVGIIIGMLVTHPNE
jgi:hypothetical protein